MGEAKLLIKDLLRRLARDIDSQAVINDWLSDIEQEYGSDSDDANWAYDVISVAKTISAMQGTTIHQLFAERIYSNQGDVMENVQKAGRDIVASAAGQNNAITVRDIATYNEEIDASSIDAELGAALKDGRKAIDGLTVDSDVMKSLIENYGNLTIELKKTTPNPSMVKVFWGAISLFAKAATPLLTLGKLIGAKLGIPELGGH